MNLGGTRFFIHLLILRQFVFVKKSNLNIFLVYTQFKQTITICSVDFYTILSGHQENITRKQVQIGEMKILEG